MEKNQRNIRVYDSILYSKELQKSTYKNNKKQESFFGNVKRNQEKQKILFQNLYVHKTKWQKIQIGLE